MNTKSSNLKYLENLMIDSGAFSVWKSGLSIDLNEYIRFCLKYKDDLQVIVALDVIPGSIKDKGELTKEAIQKACEEGWENYLKMLSAGLPKSKVIPVFHQLDGWEWLQRYLDFGSPYIGLSTRKNGIGAMAHHRIWLDQCMKYVCDSEGNPKVKLHGFGIMKTSFLQRYPWYSCDSTTWIIHAAHGALIIPRKNIDGSWNFLKTPHIILFSTKKGESAKAKGKHYESLSPMIRKTLKEYIHSLGIALGESSFRTEPLTYKLDRAHENLFEKRKDCLIIENKLVRGVCNDYSMRFKVNKVFFENMQRLLPWPRKFQFFEQSIL